jgi:membrane fusion protein, multidrug efflux system
MFGCSSSALGKAAVGLLVFIVHGQAAAAESAVPPAAVTVSPVVSRQVTETADFVGRVVAIDKVDVVARVPGFIEERNFTEGQHVKTGDLLFRIEQDTYKAAVDQQKANVAKAKATEVNAALQLQPTRFCRPERGAPRIGQREVRSSPAPPDGCAG